MKKYVLLVDGDNISSSYFTRVSTLCNKYDSIVEKHIFSNENTQNQVHYSDACDKVGFTQHTVKTSEEGNDADKSLIKLACTFINTDIDGYIIASADGDYSVLVSLLTMLNKEVVGMCEYSKCNKEYKSLFKEFHFLDEINKDINLCTNDLKTFACSIASANQSLNKDGLFKKLSSEVGEFIIRNLVESKNLFYDTFLDSVETTECEDSINLDIDVNNILTYVINLINKNKKLTVEKAYSLVCDKYTLQSVQKVITVDFKSFIKKHFKMKNTYIDKLKKSKTNVSSKTKLLSFKNESEFKKYLNDFIKGKKGVTIPNLVMHINAKIDLDSIEAYATPLEDYLNSVLNLKKSSTNEKSKNQSNKKSFIDKNQLIQFIEVYCKKNKTTTIEKLEKVINETHSNLSSFAVDFQRFINSNFIVTNGFVTKRGKTTQHSTIQNKYSIQDVNELIKKELLSKTKSIRVSELNCSLVSIIDKKALNSLLNMKLADYIKTLDWVVITKTSDKANFLVSSK